MMTPVEIDWDCEGVRVVGWERDLRWFQCLHRGCTTLLAEYNGKLFCGRHRQRVA